MASSLLLFCVEFCLHTKSLPHRRKRDLFKAKFLVASIIFVLPPLNLQCVDMLSVMAYLHISAN